MQSFTRGSPSKHPDTSKEKRKDRYDAPFDRSHNVTERDAGAIKDFLLPQSVAVDCHRKLGLLPKEAALSPRVYEMVGDAVLAVVVAEQLAATIGGCKEMIGATEIRKIVSVLTSNQALISLFNYRLRRANQRLIPAAATSLSRGSLDARYSRLLIPPRPRTLPSSLKPFKGNADVLEAVIGQVAVRQGMNEARQLITTLYQPIWCGIEGVLRERASHRNQQGKLCHLPDFVRKMFKDGAASSVMSLLNTSFNKADTHDAPPLVSPNIVRTLIGFIAEVVDEPCVSDRFFIHAEIGNLEGMAPQIVVGEKTSRLALLMYTLQISHEHTSNELHDICAEIHRTLGLGFTRLFPSAVLDVRTRQYLETREEIDHTLLSIFFAELLRIDVRHAINCLATSPAIDKLYLKLHAPVHHYAPQATGITPMAELQRLFGAATSPKLQPPTMSDREQRSLEAARSEKALMQKAAGRRVNPKQIKATRQERDKKRLLREAAQARRERDFVFVPGLSSTDE